MPRSAQLIKTNFFVPQISGGHVVRDNVLSKLEAFTDYNFTLVTTPAGYGKSTVVASWLMNQSLPYAWLFLDENDDHLYLFLKYLAKKRFL